MLLKLDTGAEVNIMPLNVLQSVEPNFRNKLKPSGIRLESFGGFSISPVGQIIFSITINNKSKVLTFVIVQRQNHSNSRAALVH